MPEGSGRTSRTSPSTHTSKKSVCSTPWTRSVSWETVRARRRPGPGAEPPKSRPFCSVGTGASALRDGVRGTVGRVLPFLHLLQTVLQGAPGQAQEARGPRDVAARLLERAADEGALDL